MKVITKTSEYELTKEDHEFVLKKTAIKPGCKSSVSVGREFRSVEAYLVGSPDAPLLMLGDMHTSIIENPDEVRGWFKENE
jgi:hypothetical protein